MAPRFRIPHQAPLKPASLISATDTTFTTANCGLTLSGHKPEVPIHVGLDFSSQTAATAPQPPPPPPPPPPMASGTIGGSFGPTLPHHTPSWHLQSLISATEATFTTADYSSLTFSGRKPAVPKEGDFQLHGSECLSSSVKLMPSARVSKECAWMLDLDALPGLGFSANHQDQVVETIFDRSELQINLKRPTANLTLPTAMSQKKSFLITPLPDGDAGSAAQISFLLNLDLGIKGYLGLRMIILPASSTVRQLHFRRQFILLSRHIEIKHQPFHPLICVRSCLHEARGWLEGSLF